MTTIEIEGVKLRLNPPDELDIKWIGNEEPLKQLIAAWLKLNDDDIPLSPRILGVPGVGKTTLGYAAAKLLASEVYIFQCTMDTRPEDLIIQPVINEENKIEYHASALVTAMIRGGICILDEANRMSEKSWASLAPLLDKRRYVESIIAGIKIKAHKNFRIAATMNIDSSTYEIPEYIDSRLQPKIYLDFPNKRDEYEILKYNVPLAETEEKLLHYIVNFLQMAHKFDKPYSIRDGINIVRYYLKLNSYERNSNIDTKNQSEKSKIDFKKLYLAFKQILDDDAIEFFESEILKNEKDYENFEDFKFKNKGMNENKNSRKKLNEYIDDFFKNRKKYIDPDEDEDVKFEFKDNDDDNDDEENDFYIENDEDDSDDEDFDNSIIDEDENMDDGDEDYEDFDDSEDKDEFSGTINDSMNKTNTEFRNKEINKNFQKNYEFIDKLYSKINQNLEKIKKKGSNNK